MNIAELRSHLDTDSLGCVMHALIAELYPICRSITGDGVRQTLHLTQQHIPLTIHEVPSGTPAFDWTVPREWNLRDAFIKDQSNRRVVDFRASNLHVVSYSTPVHERMRWTELKPHLHTLPDRPDSIPYRTSYYKDYWGFCLSHNQLLQLNEDGDAEYEVCIDSTLANGSLTYGECFLSGATDDEILISTHMCHPSMCNDNLSGIALATILARLLNKLELRYSYRFVFIPGTIGSITWLSRNEANVHRIKHGLVITGVGDAGDFTYKRSRRGNAEVDRSLSYALAHSGKPHRLLDFYPYGYDERQYCSPGFNLPVGCLMRSQHGTYPEYHTSADNLAFVKPACLAESLDLLLAALHVIESNRVWINQNLKCEPQLGKRGLYDGLAGHPNRQQFESALLWVLNYSDGDHDLLDIAERSGIAFDTVVGAADALERTQLLRRMELEDG